MARNCFKRMISKLLKKISQNQNVLLYGHPYICRLSLATWVMLIWTEFNHFFCRPIRLKIKAICLNCFFYSTVVRLKSVLLNDSGRLRGVFDAWVDAAVLYIWRIVWENHTLYSNPFGRNPYSDHHINYDVTRKVLSKWNFF